jgi:DNA-binding IclR family transcriptional regulator
MAEKPDSPQPRGKRPPRGEPVVDRALRLLEAFDPSHRRLSLSQLSRRADIPLSTARRLAERLADWGALERDPRGGYVVGLRLYEVASLAPRGLGLREVAMPYIEDLFVVTREHVQLAVLEGSSAVMVERRSRPGAVQVEYRVGGKLPILSTALGLVLLAHLPEARLRLVLAECTHPDDLAMLERPNAAKTALADVRRRGFAVVKRREPAPITAVAAPIRGRDNEVAAALSIVVPGAVDANRFEPVVRTAARGISRALRESPI